MGTRPSLEIDREKQRQSGKRDGDIEAERDGEMERQKGRETETWTEKQGGSRGCATCPGHHLL